MSFTSIRGHRVDRRGSPGIWRCLCCGTRQSGAQQPVSGLADGLALAYKECTRLPCQAYACTVRSQRALGGRKSARPAAKGGHAAHRRCRLSYARRGAAYAPACKQSWTSALAVLFTKRQQGGLTRALTGGPAEAGAEKHGEGHRHQAARACSELPRNAGPRRQGLLESR